MKHRFNEQHFTNSKLLKLLLAIALCLTMIPAGSMTFFAKSWAQDAESQEIDGSQQEEQATEAEIDSEAEAENGDISDLESIEELGIAGLFAADELNNDTDEANNETNDQVTVTVNFDGGKLVGTLPSGWTKDSGNSASKTFDSTTKGSVIQQEWANQTAVVKEYDPKMPETSKVTSRYVRINTQDDQEISSQKSLKIVWAYNGVLQACSNNMYYTDDPDGKHEHITSFKIEDYVSLKLFCAPKLGGDHREIKYECTKADGSTSSGSFYAHLDNPEGLEIGLWQFTIDYLDYGNPDKPKFKRKELRGTFEVPASAVFYIDAVCQVSLDGGPHGKVYQVHDGIPLGSVIYIDEKNPNRFHINFFRYGIWGIYDMYTSLIEPDAGYTTQFIPNPGVYPSYTKIEGPTTFKVRFTSNQVYAYPSVAQGQTQMGTTTITGTQPPYTKADDLKWKFSDDKQNVIIYNTDGTVSTISATPTDSDLYEFDRWEVKYYDGGEIQPGVITEDIYAIAHFKYKKYDVTFNLDSGTLTPEQESAITAKGWTKSAEHFKKTFQAGTGYESIIKDWQGITPSKPNYDFVSWEGAKQLRKDETFIATYKLHEYSLTAEAQKLFDEDAGTAVINGTPKVQHGNNHYTVEGDTIVITDNGSIVVCNVKATPNTGYVFKSWKINGTDVVSGAEGEITADTTFTATFDFGTTPVTITTKYQSGASEANGYVKVNGKKLTTSTIDVPYGATYEVKAPNDNEPYKIIFKRDHCDDVTAEIYITPPSDDTPLYTGFWTDAKGNYLDAGSTGEVAKNSSFTASIYDYVNTYQIGCALGTAEGTGTVSMTSGDGIMLGKATWNKSNWSQTGANTLTVTSKDHSTTFTATAEQGYAFICWAVDGVFLDGDKGEISGATTFTAYFAQIDDASVSLDPSGIGSVTPSTFKCPTPGAKCQYIAADKTLHVYLEDANGKRFWEQVVTATCGPEEAFDGYKMGDEFVSDSPMYVTSLAFKAVFHNEYQVSVSLNGGHTSLAGAPTGWTLDKDGKYVKKFPAGTTYSLIQSEWSSPYTPVREGYTLNTWAADPSGTVLSKATNMWPVWNAKEYTLTVNRHYELQTAVETDTQKVKCDDTYTYQVPTRDGYTADQTTIEGTMPAHDVTYDVYYTLNSYNLTINYVCSETGETVSESYQSEQKYKSQYSVESPTVKGFVVDPNQAIVTGEMPANDLSIDVNYTVQRCTMTFTSNDSKLGGVSQKSLEVWYGTTFKVEDDKIIFTFPDAYPGEKEVTVSANAIDHGVFIEWLGGTSGEVTSDLSFTANFEEGYLVNGKVLDVDTGTPIANATVYFQYSNTKLAGDVIYATTDENGVYSLPAILKISESNGLKNINETEATRGVVYCVAQGYEAGYFEDIDITRDCDEDEPLAQIDLKVYSGTFVMSQNEGGKEITIDYTSSSKIEKHGKYTEPVKVGACQGEDVTSTWKIDGDKVCVEYVDTTTPEEYVDNTVFTAIPKDGYEFDHWTVETKDPEPQQDANADDQAPTGKVQVDTTYTFTANYKYVGSGEDVNPGTKSNTSATSDNNGIPFAIALSVIALAGLALYTRKRIN